MSYSSRKVDWDINLTGHNDAKQNASPGSRTSGDPGALQPEFAGCKLPSVREVRNQGPDITSIPRQTDEEKLP